MNYIILIFIMFIELYYNSIIIILVCFCMTSFRIPIKLLHETIDIF